MSIKKQRRKYFNKREIEDKTQKEALIAGGFNTETNHGTRIEGSKAYADLKERYKDVLLDNISLDEIAHEHISNIKQEKDRGAKNTAIKMAIDKIEPQEQEAVETGDVEIIVRPK